MMTVTRDITQNLYHHLMQVPLDKPLRTAEDYHIRVLVPCYKESLQILQVRHALKQVSQRLVLRGRGFFATPPRACINAGQGGQSGFLTPVHELTACAAMARDAIAAATACGLL